MSKKLGTIKTTVNGATVSPKAVAEKATNVAKKATPKKPTIRQLQDQYVAATLTIDNLEAILDAKNVLIGTLESDILRLRDDNKALEREVVMLNESLRPRDEVITKLETPWYKKALNLFGN